MAKMIKYLLCQEVVSFFGKGSSIFERQRQRKASGEAFCCRQVHVMGKHILEICS